MTARGGEVLARAAAGRGPLLAELRGLAVLAGPIAASQAGTQLMSVVDTGVVGRLGSRELAAVGLGNTLFFAFAVMGIGAVLGLDPLVSQAVGAGDRVRARRLLWQGTWLAVVVSVALLLPLGIAALVVARLDIDPYVTSRANAFLLIRAAGLAPLLVFTVARAYLQALGATRPMVIAMLAGNVFNLLADVLFVFGGAALPPWLGPLRAVPALGVAGAAVSTVLGTWLQLAIVVRAVRRTPVDGAPADLRALDRAMFVRTARLGLPVALQTGAEVGIFSLVGVLAGELGSDSLAAHQVVLTLASFTFTFTLGIGAAASVRVGQAVGARDRLAARRAGFVAFAAGGAFMACCGLVFATVPEPIVRLLTDRPDVVAAALPLTVVAAVFQLSDGIQVVGAAVLRGAGDTRFAFLANLLGHWLVGFPVAWVLGFAMHRGIVGLWWGLCVGLTTVAIFLMTRFARMSTREIAPV